MRDDCTGKNAAINKNKSDNRGPRTELLRFYSIDAWNESVILRMLETLFQKRYMVYNFLANNQGN